MPETPGTLLAARRDARATVVLAVVALCGSWLVASLADALLTGRAWIECLLSPSALEVSVRLLVPVFVVVAYRSRRTARRLDVLSAVLATAPDGIQVTDLHGTIVYSNEAVHRIYGHSPAELLGRHVSELDADPTLPAQVIFPELTTRGRWEGELEVKHKDGHVFPIWLTASLVRDRRGRPLAAVGVIRDVSERKRTEEALREYAGRLEEATALKELFADILRHDLLGPAATVQLSVESLLRRQPDPLTRRIAEGARRSCAKLIELIEGASKYAKLSAAQQLDFVRTDLGAVLKDVVAESELRARERNATVVLELDGPYPVRANPIIADVFENLLSNALKYGPPDGTIRIEVRDLGDRWRASVADQGEGIADADKQRIFTRFERLRKEGVKGTGLGLAIARRIVDLHGGSIWVEDAPGGGAVFCVALRKAEEAPAPVET
jgi:PAS domain S-box-containing protein